MVHAQHVQGLIGRVEMLKGQDLFMVVLQSVGIIFKTSLGLRRGFQVKFLPSSQSLVVIGCLTLSGRRKNVLIHKPRIQIVESVARSTGMITLRGQAIILVLEKAGTRLGITLM